MQIPRGPALAQDFHGLTHYASMDDARAVSKTAECDVSMLDKDGQKITGFLLAESSTCGFGEIIGAGLSLNKVYGEAGAQNGLPTLSDIQ